MSYQVNPKEFSAVTGLPADKRMAYFVGKVADWEEAWSVGNESGWALMALDDGREAVPLWPAEMFASSFCVKDWSDRKAKSIGLDDLMTKWIPGMRGDSRLVAVFPTIGHKGIVISPDELEQRLRDALAAYD
jgi:hypothetical protein